MSNNTTTKAALGLGTILAVTASAGALIYYGGWFGKSLTPGEAVRVIPEEAALTGFIDTEPQDWAKLSQFGTPDAQKLISKNLDNLQTKLAKNNKISYAEDIQSWIGNIMWAIIPNNNSSTKSSLLLIVGIKNKLNASNMVKKLENLPGYKNQKRNYQGETITETTTQDEIKFSWAVINNQVLVSNSPETIEKSIDVHKGKPSYAQKAEVKEMINEKLSLKDPLATVYIIPDYSSWTQSLSPQKQIPPSALEQLNKIKSVVVGIAVEEQGLHLQSLSKIDPTLEPSWLKPLANKTISQVPDNTMAFINGQGISQAWDTIVVQAAKDPDLTKMLVLIRETIKQAPFNNANVQLDLDQDIFSWMNGEFALGVLPLSSNTWPNIGVGTVLLLQTSDHQKAQNTLNKLNTIAKQQGKGLITVRQNNSRGKDVTEWIMNYPMQQAIVSYTWLENDSLAMTIGMPLTAIVNTQSSNSLINSSNFKTLSSILPKRNLGYGYLDLEQISPKIKPFLSPNTPPETMSFFDSLKGILITNSFPESTLSQSDLIIGLKSTKQKN